MRKLIALVIAGLVLMFGLWWFVHYLQTRDWGQLEITSTSAGATVTAVRDGTAKPIKLCSGNCTTSLQPGTYMIKASNGSSATQTLVTIISRQTVSVSLPLKSTLAVTQVSAASGQYINASGSDLRFLNTSLQQLYEFNYANGLTSTLASNVVNVLSAFWQNHNQAILFTSDGTAYQFNSQNASPINLVKSPGGNQVILDFSANSRGDFAYVQNGTIYRSLGGKISALASDSSTEVRLCLANDGSLLVNAVRPKDPGINTIDTTTPVIGQLYTISSGGQKTNLGSSSGFNLSAWSPDSQTVAIKDDQTLKLVTPDSNSSFIVDRSSTLQSLNWIDAQTLLYVENSTIWKYDTISHNSYKLATAPGSINHNQPFAPDNDGTIYFGTDPIDVLGTGAGIYKLSSSP